MSKLNKFLIIIIIINLFATIFILFAKEKKENPYKTFEIGNFDEFISVYMLGPSPQRYRNYIQSLVEQDFKELYEQTKDLSDSGLKKYYEEKSVLADVSTLTNMQSIYGISDYETFYKLVKKLCDIYNKGAVYKKSNIVKKSCEVKDEYTTSEIIISYTKSKKIHLVVEMSNRIDAEIQTFKMSVKEDK